MSLPKKSDAESIRKRRHTTAADPLQPCSMPIIRERRQTISGKAKREARQNYQKAMIAATLSGSLIDIRKAGEKGNPPTTSTLTTETCNMCNRMENNCVNVSNVHSTVLAVSEITRLPVRRNIIILEFTLLNQTTEVIVNIRIEL